MSTNAVRLLTPRFELRELRESDVSERYLSWLRDPYARRYITAAATTTTLDDLREYVKDRLRRSDVLFLGIFERGGGVHIGNVKFEPVDAAAGYAIMGILIGDRSYRGKGVAQEVLTAAGRWLGGERRIREIALGVDADNAPAIRAYEKVGFVTRNTPHIPAPAPGTLTMVWNLDRAQPS